MMTVPISACCSGTACGHGTIALGAWAIQTGRVPRSPSGTTEVVIDVPSGRVVARVHEVDGAVTAVDFVNVPSYLVAAGVLLETSRGSISVDIGFGGALYAQVRAADVGLSVTPDLAQQLIAIGREIKWALNDTVHAKHASDDRLDGVYATMLYDELGQDADGNLHQRNATIFADGELDRSPCGSGTASRVAVLSALGELADGATLIHDSIVGTRFESVVLDHVDVDGHDAVVARVTGMAYQTGEHRFTVDPDDPVIPGFVLR